jgi:hypothetical protein
LTKCLYSRNTDDGSSIRFVGPKSLGPFLEGIFSLHDSRGVNVFLTDSKFEINNVFRSVPVNSSDSDPGFIVLTSEDEDSGALGKPVYQYKLNDRWNNTESD